MANTLHDQLTGTDLHANKIDPATGTELIPASRALLDARWSFKSCTTVGMSAASDYICDGVDDYVEINQALDAVGASGGGIVLVKKSSTAYNLNFGTITFNYDNTILMGEGYGTYLSNGGAINVGKNNCKLLNFRYSGLGSIKTANAGNTAFADTLEVAGLHYTATLSWGFIIPSDTSGDPVANHAKNLYFHDNFIRSTTTTVECFIVHNEVENIRLVNNTFINPNGGGCFNVHGTNVKNILVDGNYLQTTGGSISAVTLIGKHIVCTNNIVRGNQRWGIVVTTQTNEGGNSTDCGDIIIANNDISGMTDGVSIMEGTGAATNQGAIGGVIIAQNTISGVTFPIRLWGGSDIIIEGNSIDGGATAVHHICFGGATQEATQTVERVKIRGNTFIQNGGSGGGLQPLISNTPPEGGAKECDVYDVEIAGNTFSDVSTISGMKHAIRFQASSASPAKTYDRIYIHDNTVINASQEGITLSNMTRGQIVGNVVRNASAGGSGYAGIYLNNCSNFYLTANKCFDDRATKLQKYGIQEAGTSDNNIIVNNDVRDNLTNGIAYVGPNTVVRDNYGDLTTNQAIAGDRTFTGQVTLQRNTGQLKLSTASTGSYSEIYFNDGGAQKWTIQRRNSNDFAIQDVAASKYIFYSPTNTGRIGLGNVTDPTGVLDVNDNHLRVRTAKTPTSATDTGNQGDICWDANFVYVCVSTNQWKRVSISSW